MNFFIIGGGRETESVARIINELEKHGHKCTENWTTRYDKERGDNGEYRHVYSNMCKAGVEFCDVFILLVPAAQESHYLFGRAEGLGKKTLILGTKWSNFESGNVFYFGTNYHKLDYLDDWSSLSGIELSLVCKAISECLKL